MSDKFSVIGFTGSRTGMSVKQKETLSTCLSVLNPNEFHHGDCVGSDSDAHDMVRRMTTAKIIVHPPVIDRLRAHCDGDEVLPEKDYLVRNHDIVDISDLVIATPSTPEEVKGSGTWATIRYAISKNKFVFIINRDGSGVLTVYNVNTIPRSMLLPEKGE